MKKQSNLSTFINQSCFFSYANTCKPEKHIKKSAQSYKRYKKRKEKKNLSQKKKIVIIYIHYSSVQQDRYILHKLSLARVMSLSQLFSTLLFLVVLLSAITAGATLRFLNCHQDHHHHHHNATTGKKTHPPGHRVYPVPPSGPSRRHNLPRRAQFSYEKAQLSYEKPSGPNRRHCREN